LDNCTPSSCECFSGYSATPMNPQRPPSEMQGIARKPRRRATARDPSFSSVRGIEISDSVLFRCSQSQAERSTTGERRRDKPLLYECWGVERACKNYWLKIVDSTADLASCQRPGRSKHLPTCAFHCRPRLGIGARKIDFQLARPYFGGSINIYCIAAQARYHE
jgi:hypothetical protein